MAKINRFYNPSLSNYQEQFVPNELPADLMLKGLLAKQAKADDIRNKVNILGEYDQRALAGYDTEYVKGFKNKAQLLQDQAMQTDVTDPDFQRSYFNLARELKTDEGLKRVSNAVNTHDQYLERYKELVKKGAHADAEALRFSYEKRLGEYTKEGGQGFTGEIQLGNPLTTEGLNIQEGLEKLFDDIKASGSENAKSFKDALGASYSYETGFEGVTDKRVKQQLDNIKNNLLDSPEGKQLREEALMKLDLPDFKYEKLSKEERSKIDGQIENYIVGKALAVGKEFVYGKSSSNLAEAQQKANDRSYERIKEAEGSVLTSTLPRLTVGAPDLSYDGQLATYRKEGQALLDQWNAYKKGDLNLSETALRQLQSDMKGVQNKIKLTQQEKVAKWNEVKEKVKQEKYLGKVFPRDQIGFEKAVNDEFQKQYGSKKVDTNLKEVGFTSKPIIGSSAKVEENLVSNLNGYSFLTQDGKPINSTRIKPGTFKLVGYTQTGVYNKGLGRVGQITVYDPVYDKDGEILKGQTKERTIDVVATSNDPNESNKLRAVSEDYYRSAKALEQQGRLDEASNAYTQSLYMANPKINEFFDRVKVADNFKGKNSLTSEPLRVSLNDGERSETINLKIQYFQDGRVNLIDSDSGIVLQKEIPLETAKKAIIQSNLGLYD